MYLFDKRWFVISALMVVTLAGGYIRIDGLSHWLDNKDRYFFDDQQIPLMLTVDGYFYLDAAKAVQDGTYETYDDRRLVPDGYHRSSTPPLLAVITAFLGKLFNISLEWVAIVLPPLLGMLLALPCYLLGSGLMRRAGVSLVSPERLVGASRLAGLVTALFALLSPFLVERNSVGWFDTDVLNVSFAALFAWMAMELADSENRRKTVLWLLGYGVALLFFLWWWDQSLVPVAGLTGVPLLVAAVFLGKRSPQQMIPFVVAIVGLLLVIGFWKGFGVLSPVRYWNQLSGILGYISSDVGFSVFRAAGDAVSEQATAPLASLVGRACGGWFPFLAALVGLLGLVWLSRGYILFLASILLVAALSFTGLRFLVFWAPLFGLGIGALAFFVSAYMGKRSWRNVLLFALLVAVSWGPLQKINGGNEKVPRRMPILFDAMKIIGDNAEEDAVVWASWGHGHPLVYYTQRGVIADGIFHSAELQYVFNFPLATDNYRLAANWISFYVARGREGLRETNRLFGGSAGAWAEGLPALQKILAAGVEDAPSRLQEEYGLSGEALQETLHLLFPGPTRPVYLFLDYLLLRQPWFLLGRWDVVNRAGPGRFTYAKISGLRNDKSGTIVGRIGNARVAVNPRSGRFISGGKSVLLKEIRFYDGKKLRNKRFPKNSGNLVLDAMLPVGIGVLADTQTANTLLNKLFFEMRTGAHFFQPVAMQQPHYSIWQVTGEKYTE